MRLALLVLSSSLLLPACAGSPLEATETGTESGEGEASGGSSDGSGEEASSSSSSGDQGDGDGDASTTEWTTGDGDGDGDATATTDATGDGDGDTSSTSSTTDATDTTGTTDTTGGSGCAEPVVIEIDADQASLQGEWSLGMSQLAPQEGAVVYPNDYGAQGSASFEIDLPCDDDWHIWVKGLDRGNDDSFFVQIDGSPTNPAIFDIDCSDGNNQGSYEWEHLNERPDNSFCGEGNDWVVSGEGTIVVSFYEREAGAISALAVSNEPGYTPSF